GHARALLSVSSEATRDYMASEMARRGMSVREAENYAILMEKRSREKPLLKRRDVNEEKLEDDLGKLFGTKVRLQTGKKKGKIVIEYYSPAELDRIIEMLEKLSTRRK
ncbi:MAG: chromosome partitioning protein ParB, partial [Eubacteriales bacterium]|nr:chromosome partitioning protein ParB [Eubacteriales bacterium]